MGTLFLYLEDSRKAAGLFLLLFSESAKVMVECVFMLRRQKINLADDESFRWKFLYDKQMTDRSHQFVFYLWVKECGDQWTWILSYQAILGLGHPATVQCSLTFLPSQTVCPRGLMINSGGCVRLSGFIFLRNSAHSSIYITWEQILIFSAGVAVGCIWETRLRQMDMNVSRVNGNYRPAQFQAFSRFSDMLCSGFLLHFNIQSLPGLPDK